MSKKKSYMSIDNVINEGFFDALKNIFKKNPEVKKDLEVSVKKMNSNVDDIERRLNSTLKKYGKPKIKLPRYTTKDFK